MTEMKLLLKVEDHFLIEGRGLVLVPLLDVPPKGQIIRPFASQILVRRPDGTEERFAVQFAMEHFSIAGGGGRWSIAPQLPTATKESVPKGSEIWVDLETEKRLHGEAQHANPN